MNRSFDLLIKEGKDMRLKSVAVKNFRCYADEV